MDHGQTLVHHSYIAGIVIVAERSGPAAKVPDGHTITNERDGVLSAHPECD